MDWEEIFMAWLQSVPGGGTVIILIATVVVLSPVFKKLSTGFEEYKKQKAEKEKEKLQNMIAEKEFRENVNSIITKLPGLDERIEKMSSDVEALGGIKDTLVESVKELEKSSTREDKEIRKSLGDTQEIVMSMFQDVRGLSDKVDVMIRGDRDEFRAYIMRLYNEHVMRCDPMTPEDVEILRIRYKKYKRENGNGWAEEFYNKILGTESSDGRLISAIVSELEQREPL